MRHTLSTQRGVAVYLAILCAFHLSYILVFRQPLVTATVLFAGTVFGIALFVARRFGGGNCLAEVHPSLNGSDRSSIGPLLALSAFVLPLLTPILGNISFLHLTHVKAITLAWFLFSAVQFSWRRVQIATEDYSAAFVLFVVWASVLWVSIAWDVAVNVLYVKSTLQPPAYYQMKLIKTFSIWNSRPLTDHLGLAFFYGDDIKQAAYANHSQLFLCIAYIFVKIIQILIPIDLVGAIRLIPIGYCFFILATMIMYFVRIKPRMPVANIYNTMTLFLGIGFVLSIPDMWICALVYTDDNPFPIVICIVVMLYTYILKGDYTSKWFRILLWLLCLGSYLFGLTVLISLFFTIVGTGKSKEYRPEYHAALRTLAVGFGGVILSYSYPIIAIKYLGYVDQSSGFMFRSGLDGDIRYYQNIVQAVLFPINSHQIRPWSALIPAFIFGSITALLGGFRHHKRAFGSIATIWFLFFPYLLTLVFFPQAVSVHPYLWDLLLIFPAAFLALSWSVCEEFQNRTTGITALVFLIFMAAIVMYNLTKLAQAARAL